MTKAIGLVSGNQVPMHMKNTLPGRRVVILQNIEPSRICCAHNRFAHLLHNWEKFTENFGRHRENIGIVPPGDDQSMPGLLGV